MRSNGRAFKLETDRPNRSQSCERRLPSRFAERSVYNARTTRTAT